MSEKEVGEILEYIRDALAQIKHQGTEALSAFAKRNCLSGKNLTNFMNYDRHSNPSIKITYKILRGLLLHPPISVRTKPDYLAIPLVTEPIAAHPRGRIPGELSIEDIWLPTALLHGRHNLIAVRLASDADSMSPQLRPGDLVVIDTDDREFTSDRNLYAVRLEDRESCAVKRLQLLPDGRHVLLLSENPTYSPLAVEWREDLIIGRVVWSCTDWLR